MLAWFEEVLGSREHREKEFPGRRRQGLFISKFSPGTVGRGSVMQILGARSCGGAPPTRCPHPRRMRLSLPRHDLLGEERWPNSQRRGARSLFLNELLLSGRNDQTIDNIQRTMRAYFESGSDG